MKESKVSLKETVVLSRWGCETPKFVRAVFKWLSKVFTWLRLLRLVIGWKESRQFFNQWESKPKPIAPRTRDFSRASSELQIIAKNCNWFIALPATVVIGRSNCFGFGFSTVIWKLLYQAYRKGSSFPLEEIAKQTFRALALRQRVSLSLWRRPNTLNISFLLSSRWKFDTYQILWYQILPLY